MNSLNNDSARLATLDELLEKVIPAYLTPSPSPGTLRAWFNKARIPRFKSNPVAKRGGGPVFYSVDAVETFFRTRTLPCDLPTDVLLAGNRPPGASHKTPGSHR